MSSQTLARIPAPACVVWLSFALALGLTTTAFAQAAGEQFTKREPELANVFNAAYIVQAKVLGEISAIDRSPETQSARDQFARMLRMHASMSMAEMMAMMRTSASMPASGPFDARESVVAAAMTQLLRAHPTRAELRSAYDGSPLPTRVVAVIQAGYRFESRVYEVLADGSIRDKAAALGEEARKYLAADASVPARPKAASLLLEHAYAGTFAEAYPKLSRLLWSTRWLQLATIEALLQEEQHAYNVGSVHTVGERFQSKISSRAASGSPVPVELPMAPTIAPTLFTLSPDTAIILDNLSMFETVVADTLAYPNVADKDAVIAGLVDTFTSKDDRFDTTIDYLYSALRGGIYNQGGPATGELAHSERNRSRSDLGMQHAMIMAQ